MTAPKVRLQKYIAECGVASRRQAEKLMQAGHVSVNGKPVTQLGMKINPVQDKVVIFGQLLKQKEPKICIKINKPRGVVSSCRGYPGQKTILDLLAHVPYRLYPIGRLDKNSEGLMLLTNDGELANTLMHPRYEHEKEYVVTVLRPIAADDLTRLAEGIVVEGKKTLPAKVRQCAPNKFVVVLREGKKRQIRNMVEAVGNKVFRLKRVRIKHVRLGDLQAGQYRIMTPTEIKNMI